MQGLRSNEGGVASASASGPGGEDALAKKIAEAGLTPDYVEQAVQCRRFLREFRDGETRSHKYRDLLQRVANREEKVVPIELDDVADFFRGDDSLVRSIRGNTLRYVAMFSDAVDEVLPVPTVPLEPGDKDVIDVLREQRVALEMGADGDEADARNAFPKELMRRWELVIRPPALEKSMPMREVRSSHVGNLVRVSGIVTRMSDVLPLQRVATYTCDVCGHEIYQPVNSRQYKPLDRCQSRTCLDNNSAGELHAQTRGSLFVKSQELRLQEMTGEVPVGHIPRTLTVRVSGENTRLCVPGDMVTLDGIFLVQRYTGFRAIKAGLTADTYLDVQNVTVHKKSYDAMQLDDDLVRRVERAARSPEVYSKLARSLAPEIYGHEDIKKAMLLLLVGGVTRDLGDMRIRGDINILLSGDPGVAKSQLLKHIAHVAPRGVYTTGRGSSGVGLTAAVIRDPVTSEMTLEGGALVLADRGICCIDEFDKMEESDRTAIHEVMEQQTVSIAKAGITTTLNARASVLAAANPVWGRYNLRRTPEENIGLPTALLSRFDLTFVLRDVPDEESDAALAKHVTTVHRTSTHPKLSFKPFDATFLRAYVSRARACEPVVPTSLTDFLITTFAEMRSENKHDSGRQRFCTARTLLSILRLSQACARLRFADEVTQEDAAEATRLLVVARANLEPDDDAGRGRGGSNSVRRARSDPQTAIFNIMKAHMQSTGKRSFRRENIANQLAARGLSDADLDKAITVYTSLQLLQVSDTGLITLIGA